MRDRLIKLVFALTAGTLIGVGAAALVASKLDQARPADIEGLLWPDPKVVQPFALVDHRGEPFTLERLRGRWSFLFFGFTLMMILDNAFG